MSEYIPSLSYGRLVDFLLGSFNIFDGFKLVLSHYFQLNSQTDSYHLSKVFEILSASV